MLKVFEFITALLAFDELIKYTNNPTLKHQCFNL